MKIGVKTVGRKITEEKIKEFVYTRENLNFDAFFIRFCFTRSNGYLFSFEKRARPGRYGPATEKDVVEKGEKPLTTEEWARLFALLTGGTVKKRKGSAESGSSGPWTYLYWDGDRGKTQEYAFPSLEARKAFEAFCDMLCADSRPAEKKQEI